MPENMLRLMELYPQPMRRQPSSSMFPFRIAPATAVDNARVNARFFAPVIYFYLDAVSIFPARCCFLFSTAHHLALPFAMRQEMHNRVQMLQLFR
jgi:hypothetical protein